MIRKISCDDLRKSFQVETKVNAKTLRPEISLQFSGAQRKGYVWSVVRGEDCQTSGASQAMGSSGVFFPRALDAIGVFEVGSDLF